MAGKKQTDDSKYTTYEAGEALSFGVLVYLDGNTVKKVVDATKPVLGVVMDSGNDGESIATGDTVTVIKYGEVSMKKTAGFTPSGQTIYNTTNGEVAATGLLLSGLTAVEVIDDTTVRVRVGRAITINGTTA